MLPNNFTVAKVLTPIHCVAGSLCFQLHWGFGRIGHQVQWIWICWISDAKLETCRVNVAHEQDGLQVGKEYD